MTWTLPGASEIRGRGIKKWKTYFRIHAGDPANLSNENIPFPLEVQPTLRSAFPQALSTNVSWEMKSPFLCLSLGSEWECLNKNSFLLNNCGYWGQGSQGRPVQLVGSPTSSPKLIRWDFRLRLYIVCGPFMSGKNPRSAEGGSDRTKAACVGGKTHKEPLLVGLTLTLPEGASQRLRLHFTQHPTARIAEDVSLLGHF